MFKSKVVRLRQGQHRVGFSLLWEVANVGGGGGGIFPPQTQFDLKLCFFLTRNFIFSPFEGHLAFSC